MWHASASSNGAKIHLLQGHGVKGSGCSRIAVQGSGRLTRFFSCDLRGHFPISAATNLPIQIFVDLRKFFARGKTGEAIRCPSIP